MLPDWPTHKSALLRQVMRLMHAQAKGKSITSMIRAHPVFEGHGLSIRRADGSEETNEFHKASGEVSLPIDVIKTGVLQNALDAMHPLTTGLAKTMSQSMITTMEQGVRSVGNEINGDGRPPSAETILEMLDRVHVDFDRNGDPEWPTLMFAPGLMELVQAQIIRLGNEPDLAKRLNEITEKKRAEWSAREASRVLVG